MIEYRTRKYKDDPNSVEVLFVIDEGEEIKIEKIAILGARKIPAKTLKKVMESEEDGSSETAISRRTSTSRTRRR